MLYINFYSSTRKTMHRKCVLKFLCAVAHTCYILRVSTNSPYRRGSNILHCNHFPSYDSGNTVCFM